MGIVPQSADARKEAMTTGFVSVGKRHLDINPADTAVRDYFSVSQLFRYALAYSEHQYDQTLILAPGHDWIIHPDIAVPEGVDSLIRGKDLSIDEQRNWFTSIANQIREYCPPESQLFFHTGVWYDQLFTYLSQPDPITGNPTCYSFHTPMREQHLKIGKQLAFYQSVVGQLPSMKNPRGSK